MAIEFVRATPEMAPQLGRIFYESFAALYGRHQVPGDLPNVETGVGAMGWFTGRPDVYGVAAVQDGRIVGSNFITMSDKVAGVGPITVEPGLQSRGIGRLLMENVVNHAIKHNGPQVRLVQDAINMASLSLYSSLGFDTMEPLVLVNQQEAVSPDPTVRKATDADLDACDALCRRIYKVSRVNEYRAALKLGPASGQILHVRERAGRIVAAVVPGFFGFGVAETDEDLLSTITTAVRGASPMITRWLVPARNTELYRAVLKSGGRAVRMMNLMAMGPYEAPGAGSWFPSVLY